LHLSSPLAYASETVGPSLHRRRWATVRAQDRFRKGSAGTRAVPPPWSSTVLRLPGSGAGPPCVPALPCD